MMTTEIKMVCAVIALLAIGMFTGNIMAGITGSLLGLVFAERVRPGMPRWAFIGIVALYSAGIVFPIMSKMPTPWV